MKTFILAISLFATASSALANKVDNLKTNKDVEAFVISLDTAFRQKGGYPFIVKTTKQLWNNNDCGSLAKKNAIKAWVKADFNNDGHTDLLANVYWNGYLTFIAIDKGNDEFDFIILNYGEFDKCQLSKTIHTKDGQLVLFYSNEFPILNSAETGKETLHPDTLIYKFGHFVELTRHHSKYKIDSIIFHSGICYGICPDFSIKLDKYGNAVYEAGKYSAKQGTFKSYLASSELEEIESLIEYIQIKKLKKSYDVPWTDDATATITIKFSDGTLKHISDDGELGTFGLRALYSIFFKMVTKKQWQ